MGFDIVATPINAAKKPVVANWIGVRKVRGGFIVFYDEEVPFSPGIAAQQALGMGMPTTESKRREIVAHDMPQVSALLAELMGE